MCGEMHSLAGAGWLLGVRWPLLLDNLHLRLQITYTFVLRHFLGIRWVTREAISSSCTEMRDIALLMQRCLLSPSKPIPFF